MIPYHGTPITPEHAAVEILRGRHAMVSFARPDQLSIVQSVCQSFCIDNGAFSTWKTGKEFDDAAYLDFVQSLNWHPSFDWCLIPDVIDGDELANDAKIEAWDMSPECSVPVWHLHESLDRLSNLCCSFPRVALGSSAEFAVIGTSKWWARMFEAMLSCCDEAGRPKAKLHGLRMLDQKVFSVFPFSSADSTNIARNIGIDKRWNGRYSPVSKAARGIVLAGRIESQQSAEVWVCQKYRENSTVKR